MTVRRATGRDLASITDIYNEAIVKTVATFDTEPKTVVEQEAWFANHGSKYPIVVAESEGGIVGWASLSRWSDRCAYSGTAEISLYVRENCQRKGIGKRLIEAILEEGRKAGLHTVVARIVAGNDISVRLHESTGFHHIGVMREVGRKFGKVLDVYLMQKIYD
ncbi:N-acetyltransferase [Candidatus Poribacteria bacterium]|nr:N-acetyltransferase [Candidatus Poribacteria bacterium]